MNHYEKFNDPFECRANVLTGFPNKLDKSERRLKIFNALDFNDLADKTANEHYDECAKLLIESQPNVPTIINRARITCFSKKADDLLMWSHYADGLRGFCVEYEQDSLFLNHSNLYDFYDVEYKESPAIIDTAIMAVLNDKISDNADALDSQMTISEEQVCRRDLGSSLSDLNQIIKSMLATKPINWKYEEEVRLIAYSFDEDQNGMSLNYLPRAIKSIIFGEKMPPKQICALKRLFQKSSFSVEFKTAKRVAGSFDIIIEDEN